MVIGLLGGKGSGKTTVAQYLASAYGARCYALADELKEIIRDVFELSEQQLHGTQEQKEAIDPRWGLSPRKLMERQGDALRRVYGDAFQTARLLAQIVQDGPHVAVISDVRYPHEIARVRLAGVIWRVRHAPGMKQWPSSHSSESYWARADVDAEIAPESIGIDALHAAVDKVCNTFGVGRL